MNFSTKLASKTAIYNLMFLIALYSPKNDNKQPSEMRNWHHRSYVTVTKVFLGLDPF